MDEAGGWASQLLLVGLATARFAAAFLLVPLFTPDIMPATVRNSVLVALGLVVLYLLPPLDMDALGLGGWISLYLKEVFVGCAIGLFFGSILWALAAAGEIIDTKIGSSMGQLADPASGQTSTLNAVFLGRLANLVFVSAGGLLLLVGTILESHAVWPMGAAWPDWSAGGGLLFSQEFGRLMAITALVAGPVLVILFLVDLGLGLVNRFAQQLNVFQLSLSIKALAGTFVLILMIPALVAAILADLAARPAVLRALLEGLAQ